MIRYTQGKRGIAQGGHDLSLLGDNMSDWDAWAILAAEFAPPAPPAHIVAIPGVKFAFTPEGEIWHMGWVDLLISVALNIVRRQVISPASVCIVWTDESQVAYTEVS